MRIASGMITNSAMPHIGGRRPGLGTGGGAPGNIEDQLNAMIINSARFVSQAGPRSASLSNTLSNLSSVLGRVTANSENTDVLRVASFTGSKVPETSVQIDQAATTQRNDGKSLRANDRDMPSGKYSFEIEVGGKTREISFTATAAMTNREFQQRMAEAVNQANIGVVASVSTANNHSALRFESRTTGSAQDFSVRDITGNAVEAMGVGTATQEAQDAKFSVNGGEQRTSATNEIDLGSGLRVTLVDSSDKAVAITGGRDAVGAQNSMRQIVSQVNSLLEAARGNESDLNTRRLVRDLESVLHRNRKALGNMGITMGRNGQLTVDESRLRTAAEDGSVHNFLSGTGSRPSSFVSDLSRITDSISSNPMRHISRHAANTPGFDSILSALSSSNQTAMQQAARPDNFIPQDLLNFLTNLLG